MYELDRTKKVMAAMFCVSVISMILAFIGFAGGGEELIKYGYMNNPGHTILMFVSFGIFVVSLLAGLGLRAVCKDFAEVVKYIDNRK